MSDRAVRHNHANVVKQVYYANTYSLRNLWHFLGGGFLGNEADVGNKCRVTSDTRGSSSNTYFVNSFPDFRKKKQILRFVDLESICHVLA